tara:strand:- start:3980 stop:4849 length:870 start_codon:yes stop_codon:yes gene_type:complete
MKNYLITGGGKCGSHFITKYLDVFCNEDFYVHKPEIKSFKEIKEINKKNKNLIIQKSFISREDVTENIKKYVDSNFEVILIERYPPQQFLAWYYTLFSNFLMYPRNTYKNNRTNKHFIKWCFDHVEASIELKKHSNFVTQIEKFTSEFNERNKLIKHITNKNIVLEDENDKNFMVSKSNFGKSEKIININYGRYPNVFSSFELKTISNLINKGNFQKEYLLEFKKNKSSNIYSNYFWNERILFYHNLFFQKNKIKITNKKFIYLLLIRSKKLFKILFNKKFINEDAEFI